MWKKISFLVLIGFICFLPYKAKADRVPERCWMDVTFDVTPKKITNVNQTLTLKATVKDASGKDCTKDKVLYTPTFSTENWGYPFDKPSVFQRGVNDSSIYNKLLTKTFKASEMGFKDNTTARIDFLVAFPDYSDSWVQASPVEVVIGTPPSTGTNGSGGGNNSNTSGGGGANTGDSGVGLDNPLEATSLIDLFLKFINTLLMLIGSAAVLFIIIGGFKMTASGGKQETIDSGKRTVTWAVIGLIVTLMSWSIVIVVQGLLRVK
jgi:hypothetical protein